jgi:hypothetical protein
MKSGITWQRSEPGTDGVALEGRSLGCRCSAMLVPVAGLQWRGPFNSSSSSS